MPLPALALALVLQSPADPLLLPIGRSGTVNVGPGELVSTSGGRTATPADIARAARGTRFVYLGETHDNRLHHEMQAEVIRALVADGRDVIVGLEMFTRPVQANLAPWTLGKWTDEQFIEESQWKTQWRMDFTLYKPIFDAAKEHALPLVALNAPREWVRAVGRGGLTALTPEQRSEVPARIDLGNKGHRMVFESLMGGHPISGEGGENIYSAQVLWDEVMADTAIKYLAGRTARNVVIAIVAGSGHVMYGQGINWRVLKRTGDAGITVMMAEAEERRPVSRGIGDFVYVTPPVERKPAQ